MSDDTPPRDDSPPRGEQAAQDAHRESLRGTVELPRVVLGSDEAGRAAPHRRVLPGLVDLRWLSYPAYIACFAAGGLAVNFAIDGREWAAPPIAIAWAMLFFWEWIYGVAYRYRRPILKYVSFLLVAGLSALLAGFCWERAEPQLVAATRGVVDAQLVERGYVDGLNWAAICTILSGALITLHVAILGRGWREADAYHQPGGHGRPVASSPTDTQPVDRQPMDRQ